MPVKTGGQVISYRNANISLSNDQHSDKVLLKQKNPEGLHHDDLDLTWLEGAWINASWSHLSETVCITLKRQKWEIRSRWAHWLEVLVFPPHRAELWTIGLLLSVESHSEGEVRESILYNRLKMHYLYMIVISYKHSLKPLIGCQNVSP